ncbi:MAG: epimerase [Actinomycetota bacterium]|nr:epimerase [Actinomycetota bacterium]
MRLLVLGGTVFLSRTVAALGVDRGHDVVCAARGESGAVPEGARHVHLDRAAADWSGLEGPFDCVVDVARVPSWVRDSLDALADRTAHWTFVSTINVYADDSTPGGTPATLPVREALEEDVDQEGPEDYGRNKVACEQLVSQGVDAALVVRPGLIVGPGDPTGRYSYWPERLADGGEVLAPGPRDRTAQVVDVRDLAEWILDCSEAGRTGTYDATSPVGALGDLLAATARGVGSDAQLTWVPQEFLAEQRVDPWMGDRSLPLYLPLPEYAGLMAHDVSGSLSAGLRIRAVEDTAADTLAWLHANPTAARTGLTRTEEQDVLNSWHTIRK